MRMEALLVAMLATLVLTGSASAAIPLHDDAAPAASAVVAGAVGRDWTAVRSRTGSANRRGGAGCLSKTEIRSLVDAYLTVPDPNRRALGPSVPGLSSPGAAATAARSRTRPGCATSRTATS
jgi:hypothetical protein